MSTDYLKRTSIRQFETPKFIPGSFMSRPARNLFRQYIMLTTYTEYSVRFIRLWQPSSAILRSLTNKARYLVGLRINPDGRKRPDTSGWSAAIAHGEHTTKKGPSG